MGLERCGHICPECDDNTDYPALKARVRELEAALEQAYRSPWTGPIDVVQVADPMLRRVYDLLRANRIGQAVTELDNHFSQAPETTRSKA